ncbi:MAG: polysaccharide lyase family 8 super-sandwich domain-containing protein [Bacteroidaceae bacterium]
MKKLILTSSLLVAALAASAQATYSFDFEDGAVPAQWTAAQGTLTVTSEHHLGGTKALCWEVPAGQKAELTVSFDAASTSAKEAFFNLYSAEATGSALTVEYLNASQAVQLTTNVTVNFRGWRDYERAYMKDMGVSTAKTIAYVRMTLDNSGRSAAQKLMFDNVDFRKAVNGSRQAQELMVKDVAKIADGYKALLITYSQTCSLPLTEPTADELSGLAAVQAAYAYKPESPSTPRELPTVRNYVKGLNIQVNADGTVTGDLIVKAAADYTYANFEDLVKKLNYMASSSTASDAPLFSNFLDLFIEQGCAYRFPQLKSNTYSQVRTLPKLLLNLLPKCNETQKEEVLKMVCWVSEANWLNASPDYLATKFSSDIIYNYLSHYVSYAAYLPDTKEAVRAMKAFVQFLENVLTPVEGGYDTVKPDYVGFHHGTMYHNYMYAYNGWIDAATNLKGTAFRVSPLAYERMKRCILAHYTMANRSSSGQNFYANSVSGRHPLSGGHIVQCSRQYLEQLIGVGTDVLGYEDQELTSAYNYFFLSDKYTAPEADYTGFHQFNYGQVGIYRGEDWVVTMRAPTTRMWGAEIYSTTSRFSRYQSHGTMEVVYNGPLANSGLPVSATGYDWNVAPGGTTVHFTNWKEMMPKSSTTQRFDQFTKTKDFAGALSFGDCGVWACDFDQVDTWGGECFTPTNLVFKKSVYAFDGMLIDLGSNISSSGSYADDRVTATNLFQEVGSDMGALTINGTAMNNGDAVKTLEANTANWFLTPKGTGYYIPAGNDAITVKYGTQEGPNENGSDVDNPATAVATKAYINHGVKPTDKNYVFVMKPKTTASEMQELASKVGNDGGEYFSILSQTDKFHALMYKPENITAYAFFEAVENTNLPVVKAVGSELLVMQQPQADGTLKVSVCNPNLRLKNQGTGLGQWDVDNTETSVTLEGEWYNEAKQDGVVFNAPANGQTVINLTLRNGFPIHFTVGAKGHNENSIATPEETGLWMQAFRQGDQMTVQLAEANADDTVLELYTAEGIKVGETRAEAGQQTASIRLQPGSAVQVLRVKNGDKVKTVKCIF